MSRVSTLAHGSLFSGVYCIRPNLWHYRELPEDSLGARALHMSCGAPGHALNRASPRGTRPFKEAANATHARPIDPHDWTPGREPDWMRGRGFFDHRADPPRNRRRSLKRRTPPLSGPRRSLTRHGARATERRARFSVGARARSKPWAGGLIPPGAARLFALAAGSSPAIGRVARERARAVASRIPVPLVLDW